MIFSANKVMRFHQSCDPFSN